MVNKYGIQSPVITLNATSLSSGLYFCTLQANGFTETRKMLLVK